MKKLPLLFVVLFGVVRFNFAQNLVPNGSFETLDPSGGCPISDSFYSGRPQYWTGYYPGGAAGPDLSGDFFTPCATPGYNYPGLNEAGCALPLNGNSYCGFLASAVNVASPNKESEYIMNSNISLTAGQNYYVEFYVRNAGGSGGFPSTAYSRNIGAFFTPTPGTLPTGQTNGLNNISITKPQIPNVFPAADYYTNTDGWQKISGYFTPSQTGTWTMVIGNFDPGMNTMISKSCGSTTVSVATPDLKMKDSNSNVCNSYVSAYYFVDAVTVIPANQTPPSYSPYISGGSTVCPGSASTYTLQNIPFGATASWSVTPASLFSGATSGTGSTASITAASGVSGAGTLTYSLSSSCGTIQGAAIALNVGVPVFTKVNVNGVPANFDGASANQFYVSATNTVEVNAQTLGSSTLIPVNFYMQQLGPYTVNTLSHSSTTYAFSTKYNTNYFELIFNASNNCGTASGGIYFCNVNCSNNGVSDRIKHGRKSLSVFPNPASTSMTVQLIDDLSLSSDAVQLDEPYSVIVYNRFSQVVFTAQVSKTNFQIPLDGLPQDVYYLNVFYGGELLREQIIVTR